jgi:hypothetical protein
MAANYARRNSRWSIQRREFLSEGPRRGRKNSLLRQDFLRDAA